MAEVRSSRIWTQQPRPQIAARIRSEFAPRFALLPNVTSNLVTGNALKAYSTVSTTVGEGVNLLFSGNLASVADATVVSPGTAFTCIIRYKNIVANTNGIFMAGKSYYANANGWMFESKNNTDTLEINGGDGSTFPTLSVPGVGAADGKFHTLVVRYSGTTASVAFDGKAIGSVTIVAPGAWPFGVGVMNYSNNAPAGNATDRLLAFAAIINNTGNIADLSANPWQLFAPQRQVSYFLPSTGITPLVSRRVWTRQPQSPVRLDPKYGAVAGVYGSMVWNAASEQSTTIDTNGVSTAVYAGSLGKKFTGSGTGSIKAAIPQDTAAYTYVFNAILAGAGLSGLGRPLSTFNGTGGHDLFFSSSSLRIQEWFSTLRGEWYIDQNTFFYTPKTFVISYDASSASNIPRVWVDGRRSTVFVNTTPSGSRISGGLTLGIGNRPDTTARQLDGVMFMAAMLPYAANDGLAQSLSLNPWQLFAPQQQVTYFGTSGGGTVYNLSISETSLTSDSISSIVTWFASLSETATVSDSPSTTVIFPTAISETATVSDSPTTTVIFPTAISETATVSDSPSTTVIFPTAISETATGSDATASSFALSSAVSETATGNDITDSAFALASAVSETATASDSSTTSLIANASVSETATASESVTTVLIIYPSISETAGAADTITTIATLNVGVAETVTAADIVTGATTMNVTLSETATASDSVTGANVVSTAIAETATASESVDSSLVYLGNIDETVVASESISTIATQNVFVLETATAADSVTIGGSYQVSLSETVVAADAATSRFLWEPIDTNQTPGWSNISTTQNANWSSITTTQTANWQPVNTGS